MRIALVIFMFCVFSVRVAAQHLNAIIRADSVTNSLYNKSKWKKLSGVGKAAIRDNIEFYNLYYRTGVAYYKLKKFTQSEHYLKKSFSIYATKDAAQYIYGGLAMRGLSLEAATFNEKYKHITEIKEHIKTGTESLYFDFGPRISTNPTLSGNIYYADFGRISRPAFNKRLVQSIMYLQQDNPNDNYKQFEYSISRESYYKNGWYFKPTAHYALTLYSSNSSNNVPYFDSTFTQRPPPLFPVTVVRKGKTVNKIETPGTTNSISIGYGLAKRIGGFTFGIEPAVHGMFDRNTIKTIFSTHAKTDSFTFYGKYSQPYFDSGNNKIDTGAISFIGQFGTSVSYIWPLKGSPISTKLSAYFLFDNYMNMAIAYNLYTFVMATKKLWLHFSYTYKGGLPWINNNDGQYFNTYNTINSRLGLTLQFLPLKKFSPMLTYQFEDDSRAADNKEVYYNSIYLTFKFNL